MFNSQVLQINLVYKNAIGTAKPETSEVWEHLLLYLWPLAFDSVFNSIIICTVFVQTSGVRRETQERSLVQSKCGTMICIHQGMNDACTFCLKVALWFCNTVLLNVGILSLPKFRRKSNQNQSRNAIMLHQMSFMSSWSTRLIGFRMGSYWHTVLSK